MIHPLLLLAVAVLASNRKAAGAPDTAKKPAAHRAPEERAARAAIDALPEPVRGPLTADVVHTPDTPKQVATALRLHLERTRSFGSKGHPDRIVAQAQRELGVAPADGVVGPATRNAARKLGITLPLRSAT
jgi:hypothetical protein